MPDETINQADTETQGKPEKNAGADTNSQPVESSLNAESTEKEEGITESGSAAESTSAPTQEDGNTNQSSGENPAACESSESSGESGIESQPGATERDFIHSTKITVHDFVVFIENCEANVEQIVSEELTAAHLQIEKAITTIKAHFQKA